jgi:hypothetical protein
MHLVKSMVDRIAYEYCDRTMRVSVAKRLPSAASPLDLGARQST